MPILLSPSLFLGYESGSSTAQSLVSRGTPQSVAIGSSSASPLTIVSASPQSDFVNFANNTVPSLGQASLVDEPSVANKGPIVFYTGNHYSARSSDGGFSWTNIDPSADMSDFCCDQDVIYVPSQSIFVWERLGVNESGSQGRIRLSVSTEASSWLFSDFHTYDLNSAWANQWFDYPQLAVSNNYLYVTANLFTFPLETGTWQRTVILRIPLGPLKTGGQYTYSYFSSSTTGFFNSARSGFFPVQGATDTMYWGAHVACGFLQSNQCVRVYKWQEGTDWSSITSADVQVPSFSVVDRNAHCPSPDGGDACARADSRIVGAWVANHSIGFVWEANSDSNHPMPYVDAARIDEQSMTLLDSPILWNSNYAWLYGYVSPNARGDLGIVTFCSGATSGSCSYPTFVAGVFIGTASQSPWDLYRVSESTNGPSQTCLQATTKPCWGDYVRVRPFGGNGNVWIASGFVLHGGSQASDVSPRFIVFGHSPDGPTLTMHYTTVGGGTNHPNPTLSYTTNGVVQVAELQEYDTTYSVDYGSHWSVSPELLIPSGEKWLLSEASTGTAYAKTTLAFTYYYLPAASSGSSGGPSGQTPSSSSSQIPSPTVRAIQVIALIVATGIIVGMTGVLLWIYRIEKRRRAFTAPPLPRFRSALEDLSLL